MMRHHHSSRNNVSCQPSKLTSRHGQDQNMKLLARVVFPANRPGHRHPVPADCCSGAVGAYPENSAEPVSKMGTTYAGIVLVSPGRKMGALLPCLKVQDAHSLFCSLKGIVYSAISFGVMPRESP